MVMVVVVDAFIFTKMKKKEYILIKNKKKENQIKLWTLTTSDVSNRRQKLIEGVLKSYYRKSYYSVFVFTHQQKLYT